MSKKNIYHLFTLCLIILISPTFITHASEADYQSCSHHENSYTEKLSSHAKQHLVAYTDLTPNGDEDATTRPTSEKIKQFQESIHSLPGTHYFQRVPSFLPTGIPLSDGMRKYDIERVESSILQTTPPSWGKPFTSSDQTLKYSLDYRLENVLLPYDPEARGAGIYILLPNQGYLIPVNEASETSQVYRSMLNGEPIDIKKSAYMQEIFAAGGIHHAGSVRPGEHGKNVIALHSSRFRTVPGKYVEGRYPTIGQLLATLEVGDEVVYFVSQGNEYNRYFYEVKTIENVAPDGMGTMLYPTGGFQALLYTCTDFGRTDKRLVVTLDLVEDQSDTPTTVGLLQINQVPVEYRNIIDRYFANLVEDSTYDQVQDRAETLREYIEAIESSSKPGSILLKQVLRYLKYKIAEVSI